jgi:WS/DGAT/MGAT family acyltransferase
MATPIEYGDRMSDGDALLWHIEKDPQLRSTILVLWLLDRAPDRARFEAKVERATRTIPRLRQRVMSNPASLAPPRWELDPSFDRKFHLRWMAAPGDASLRAVLDSAEPIAMQGFDRARPLWELYVIEGMANGGAAMLMKLHHSLSDGVGLVSMTTAMVERSREGSSREKPMPELPASQVMSQRDRVVDALGHEWRRQLGRARRVAGALPGLVTNPIASAQAAAEAISSLGRLLRPVGEPLSPIMRGRSLSVRFDKLEFSVDALRAASKRVDGKLNDAFVAGVAGGLRLYHEAHGAPIEAIRMSMPINIRDANSEAVAGNQFVPARFPIPVGEVDPLERMRRIRGLVGAQRAERGLPMIEGVAGVLTRLPAAFATELFGSVQRGVDITTSNVPGPPMDVYVSGAKLDAVYGFGPLAGAAVNITLFSQRGVAHLGINSDPAAVPDPEQFTKCIANGFAEVLSTQP